MEPMQSMPNDDNELIRLQDEERAARERFDVMRWGVRDTDIIRHAKDLWLEAQAAFDRYQSRKTAP